MKKDEGKYRVKVKGLKEGVHFFEFNIGTDFFDDFRNSEIKKANIRVDLTLNKEPQNLELDFRIKGFASVVCDRCLEIFELPLSSHQILFVKFGEKTIDDGSDVMILSNDDEEIDLTQILYEFTSLSLPLKKVHPVDENGESTCNEEMLKKLKKLSPSSNDSDKTINPGWDELKKIKFNN